MENSNGAHSGAPDRRGMLQPDQEGVGRSTAEGPTEMYRTAGICCSCTMRMMVIRAQLKCTQKCTIKHNCAAIGPGECRESENSEGVHKNAPDQIYVLRSDQEDAGSQSTVMEHTEVQQTEEMCCIWTSKCKWSKQRGGGHRGGEHRAATSNRDVLLSNQKNASEQSGGAHRSALTEEMPCSCTVRR